MTTQTEVISELEYKLEISQKRIRDLEYDCSQLQRQVNDMRNRSNKNANFKGKNNRAKLHNTANKA